MAGKSKVTEEKFKQILTRIAEGESLRSISNDKGMPGARYFYQYLEAEGEEGEDRRKQYARARQQQADGFADEMVSIADNPEEDVNRSKLRVDTRKWIAAKLKPKVYSDKHIVEGGGENGEHEFVLKIAFD